MLEVEFYENDSQKLKGNMIYKRLNLDYQLLYKKYIGKLNIHKYEIITTETKLIAWT